MTPETKKKIEEAAIKYGWSLASKEVAMIGYSLAAEDSAEKIEMHKSVLRGAIGSLAKIVNVVGFKGEEADELPDFISKKISSLEFALRVAEEALEYYGSEKNWYSTNSTDLDKPEIKMVIASLDTEGSNWLGGRTARKALQTIRPIRGEDKG